jgi:hypothetical protein
LQQTHDTPWRAGTRAVIPSAVEGSRLGRCRRLFTPKSENLAPPFRRSGIMIRVLIGKEILDEEIAKKLA